MKSYSQSIGIIVLLALLSSCLGVKHTSEIKTKRAMVKLTTLTQSVELKIGEKAVYAGSVHGSVGTQKKCWSSDDDVLKLIDKDIEYHNKPKPGETGGDRATKTYIFEAISEGEATVIIQNWFRGDLEEESKIKVTITK